MAEHLTTKRVEAIRVGLLRWYDRHRRRLPWRETSDPYRVWVSEVMLQQTRVDTVIPYYDRWIERFPTVEALASAELTDVLRSWSGLGYYSRARNLHRAATVVRDSGGAVPRSFAKLRDLPGIGDYTAGAIASIAFNVPVPAVDGNARRVVARLLDLDDPTLPKVRRICARLVPEERPGAFNQALMELGATICTPRSPECASCPVAEMCRARRLGTIDQRPGPARKRATPSFTFGAAIVAARETGRVLLAQRPESGLLGGLWEFPSREVTRDERPDRAALRAARSLIDLDERPIPIAEPLTHTFTHRRHEYHPFLFTISDERPITIAGAPWPAAQWIRLEAHDAPPLSAAQKRLAQAALSPLSYANP